MLVFPSLLRLRATFIEGHSGYLRPEEAKFPTDTDSDTSSGPVGAQIPDVMGQVDAGSLGSGGASTYLPEVRQSCSLSIFDRCRQGEDEDEDEDENEHD